MNSTNAADPSTHPVSPVSIAIPTPRRLDVTVICHQAGRSDDRRVSFR
jgi:hypothetical protein